MPPIDRHQITGLVLAGGRGSRMGGVDKGLQLLGGQPLVQHAITRLAPQVGPLLLNANRHLERYAAFGLPVVPDALPDHPGPLAGMLAALEHCRTPYLMSVPCDTPHFPPDLVARLAALLQAQGAALAIPQTTDADGQLRPQPVFCLMHHALRDSLARFVGEGQARINLWARQQGCVYLPCDDAQAFFNANTLQDLESLQR